MQQLATNKHVGNTSAADLLRGKQQKVTDRGCPAQPSATGSRLGMERFLGNQVFTSNPPLHAPFRQVVARPLSARNVQEFRPLATALARRTLDEAAHHGQVDVRKDITSRYAVMFWTELLGFPAEYVRTIQDLMDRMSSTFQFHRTPAEQADLDEAAADYMDLIESGTRHAVRSDSVFLASLAGEFAALDVEGRPEDLGPVVGSNFFDAFHTIGTGVANCIYEILRTPQAFDRLRTDPSLATQSFLEGVRVAAPLTLTRRTTLTDVMHGDTLLPAGTRIDMLWGPANRDPQVFEQPQKFDLDRRLVGTATFGGGVHVCPGRNAARLLADVLMTELSSATTEFALVEHPHQWIQGSSIRQLESCPVSVRIARGAGTDVAFDSDPVRKTGNSTVRRSAPGYRCADPATHGSATEPDA